MAIKDFQSNQIRATKLIASGNTPGQPAVMIYSASNATNFQGGHDLPLEPDGTIAGVGTDVFLFVSGSSSDPTGSNNIRDRVVLFGGDLVVSGTLFAERTVIEVDLNQTGSLTISGSLFVDTHAHIAGNLYVTGTSHLSAVAIPGLTQGRIVTVGVTGTLEDGANLTYNHAAGIFGVTGSRLAIYSTGFAGITGSTVGIRSANPVPIYSSDEDILDLQKAGVSLMHFSRSDGVNSAIRASVDGAHVGVLVLSSAMGSEFISGLGTTKRIDLYNTDTNFFVSGVIGSANTTTRGASVFSGDLVVSGTAQGLTGVSGSYLETGLIKTPVGNLLVDAAGDITIDADGGNIIFQDNTVEYGQFLETGNLRAGKGLQVTGSSGQRMIQAVLGSAPVAFGDLASSNSRSMIIIHTDDTDHNGDIVLAPGADGDNGKVFLGIGRRQVAGNYMPMMSGKGIDDSMARGRTAQVLVMSGGASTAIDESRYTDMNFFVSGTVGAKNSINPGTALFGGDLHVSGNLSVESDIDLTGSFRLHHPSVSTGYAQLAQDANGQLILANSSSNDDIKIIVNAGGANETTGLFVDGGAGVADSPRVGIGVAPSSDIGLRISGSAGKIQQYARQVEAGSLSFASYIAGAANGTMSQNRSMVTASIAAPYTLLVNRSLNTATADTTAVVWVAGEHDERTNENRTVDIHIGQVRAYDPYDQWATVRPALSITSGSIGAAAKGERNTGSGTQVLILSGGDHLAYNTNIDTSASSDPQTYRDTNFWVSGAIGSRETTTRGVAAFGGDLHVSGNLTVAGTSPGGSGGGASSVGWFTGSAGFDAAPAGWIHTTGSLVVSGANLDVSRYISHIGNTTTKIEFDTDRIKFYAADSLGSSRTLLSLDGTPSGGASIMVNGDNRDFNFIVSGRESQKSIISVSGTYGDPAYPSATLTDTNLFLSGTQVLILSGGTGLIDSGNPAWNKDTNFWVSGTIGSKGNPIKGTAVFAGDAVISGSTYTAQVPGTALRVGSADWTMGLAGSNNIADFLGSNPSQVNVVVQNAHAGSLPYYMARTSLSLANSTGQGFSLSKYSNSFIMGASINEITADSGRIDVKIPANARFGVYSVPGAKAAHLLTATASNMVLVTSGGASTDPDPIWWSDSNFWVSGTIGAKDVSGSRGTSVFGGDVVISGSLYGGSPLKLGSDTRLVGTAGSTQYFNFGATDSSSGYGLRANAGTMEFKNNGGSWSTMGSGGGSGGGITIVSGSASTGSVTSLNLDMLGYVMNLGGGTVALTGTLGASEEGTFSDGLFSTWHENTPIGTAIDKINEVLKYLSPLPAPDLDNLNSLNTGVTSKLSFGTSNAVSSYTNVGAGAGIGSAVDVNEVYQVVTSSNNIRLATFDGATAVTGVLNSDVTANIYNNGVINYSGSTWSDADQGSMLLSVNGSTVVTVNLASDAAGAGQPGAGTGTSLAGGSGFFELSQTGSAYQSSNAEFGLFKNRTGKFKVHPSLMRNGWNYAIVNHVVGTNTKTTNYIEWVIDASGSAVKVHDPRLSGEGEISLGGNIYLSGIHYATGADGKYRANVLDYYQNVFTNETITFGQTNCSIPAGAVPDTSGGAGSQDEIISVTGSFSTSVAELLGGTIGVNVSIPHVLKTDVTTSGSITSGRFLIFSASNNSTSLVETFNRENYRLQSGSFSTQSATGSAVWNSTTHVTAAAGYSDGLAFYDNKLYAPANTLNSGDFRSVNDSGSYFGDGYSYDGNPNYSGLNSGVKSFFRAFVNNTGNDVRDFDIVISGGGSTIVPAGTSIVGQAGKIRVHAKVPGKTGFLDLGASFVYNTGSDGAGGRIGALDATVDGGGATNHFSFGTGSISHSENVVLKIETDADWTGNIDDITITFPAVGISDVPESPDVGNANCSDTGADAKLSFGPTKTIGGYTDVGSVGVGSVDLNGSYVVSSDGDGDLRRGIFGGATDINGVINDATTASGNAYPADSFGTAATGTLALEVNGELLVSTDLHNFVLGTVGNDSVVNGNGSGFLSVSQADVGKDAASLPDYRRFFRTGSWNVDTSDQRQGWNYARVVHSQSAGNNVTTNYVEWVNDSDSNTMGIDNQTYSTYFGDNAYYYQSGVKYFIDPTGSVEYRVTNGYTNVYSNSTSALSVGSLTNLTVTRIEASGSGVINAGANASYIGMPNLETAADSQTLPISVTGSVSFTQSESLPGTWGNVSYGISATCNASHPRDTNKAEALAKSNFLVYTGSLTKGIYTTNGTTTEVFGREDYRLQSGSFANQSVTSSMGWNSALSLESGGATYNTGLLLYNNRVCSPSGSNLPNYGNFKDTNESGALTAAASNVDYTTLTNSERNYYRAFLNSTTSDQADVSITLYGDATLVPRVGSGSGTPGANKYFHLDVKIPGKTGWMDAARPANGAIIDGSGALAGDRDGNVDGSGATNIADFQTAFVAGTAAIGGVEHFMVRIVADKQWTGYISRIIVSYG